MTITQDGNTDADRPDNDVTAPLGETLATSNGDAAGPPQTDRVDVRRRLMALRRW
ncbi:hypothetical protein POF50_029235 [Streptomyces sp. SL13]|uniref:Uncharacterized protein n=1 Tax=Streptantibioticus silvisoli TaxID=2705255 RepID=A0AA90H8Y3_9ACTN|nr:hypothetical protein [Streptantibioticus silvisoli]MDI5973381.1 hypothetical protein [Streptantibioticus silvisoli]